MQARILHVIPTLASGGAERQLVDIVSNTSEQYFSHTLCLLRNENFYLSQHSKPNLEIISFDLHGKYPWLKAAQSLGRTVKDLRPDILHSWLFDGDVVARLVKLKYRDIPLITSLQTPAYDPATIVAGAISPIKITGLRMIDSSLARLTDPHFVACSKFVATSAIERIGAKPDRVSVIYNSVDLATLACKPDAGKSVREELGISSSAFVFLGVGRLDIGKGFSQLVHALLAVAKIEPETMLVIVGKGPQETQLQELIVTLGLESRVILAGRRRDIGAFLEMADAFVFPTRFEGLGIALIEAMSKGLPCIASKLPVLEEVVTNGLDGILIDPNSSESWVESMVEIMRDPDLRQCLGSNAIKTIHKRFTSDVLIPQWEELYQRILNRQ
jgi:glycosyltransferase involved in cell wall biosynthesis